ncbi:MAG: glycogen/starch synthase [Pseudomonadota bacterium]
MKVLSVASECAPLVKTGGLADVVGALPGALAPEGVEMRVMLPAYPGLLPQVEGAERVEIDLGGTAAHLVAGKAAGLPVILLDAPALYARDGAPYAGPDGVEYPDNAERFGLFAWAAAEVATQGFGGWQPDAVHAHDWQAALGPAASRARR